MLGVSPWVLCLSYVGVVPCFPERSTWKVATCKAVKSTRPIRLLGYRDIDKVGLRKCQK